tara:strand:- start:710 stop:1072 length:363 start_codon:yes stop_codon:yes gene_type:complete
MEQMGAFLPLILIFGVFYFLLIRPQQKKMRLHREMISNLKRGDKIITTGGIIGVINKVKDSRELVLEISDNVEIQIAPGMVTELYLSPETKQTNNTNTTSNPSKDEKKGLLSGMFNKKNN